MLLWQIKEQRPDSRVITVTASVTMSAAAERDLEAFEFLAKPVHFGLLKGQWRQRLAEADKELPARATVRLALDLNDPYSEAKGRSGAQN